VKYIKKPIVVEAHPWYVNGDHPNDGNPFTEGDVVRYFRHPDIAGSRLCQKCEFSMHHHGWIDNNTEDGYTVCPGDYIVMKQDDSYEVYSQKNFHNQFEKYEKENETIS